MIQVKRGLNRGMKACPRDEYHALQRHPVRVVSWATGTENIGGTIRTCEAFLVDKLFALAPPHRSLAVGTDRWQPFERGGLVDAIGQARADGYTIVALEQTDESVALDAAAMPERMCLVVGNEGTGIGANVLALCDMAVEIRQFGYVGSLNVVTATSIALYEWTRQHALADLRVAA